MEYLPGLGIYLHKDAGMHILDDFGNLVDMTPTADTNLIAQWTFSVVEGGGYSLKY